MELGSEGELGQGWLLASLGNYALHAFCKRNDGTLAAVGRWGLRPLRVTVSHPQQAAGAVEEIDARSFACFLN